MQIEISEEERELLLHLLQSEMGEIRQEIHHTKTTEYRENLKLREGVMRELIQKLDHVSVIA